MNRFVVLTCEGHKGHPDAWIVSDTLVLHTTVREFGTNPEIEGSAPAPLLRAIWKREADALCASLNADPRLA